MDARHTREPVVTSGRLPWTRRVALEYWNRCVTILSLVATSAIALAAAFRGDEVPWDVALLGTGFVLALPGLWIGLTRVAERKYLTRPPKRFLAAALGLDFGGIALVAAGIALLQAPPADAAPLLTAGGAVEGVVTALFLAWFLAVRAVEPCGDHMQGL